jgi:hypothetical protein
MEAGNEGLVWEAVTEVCKIETINAISAYVLAKRPPPAPKPDDQFGNNEQSRRIAAVKEPVSTSGTMEDEAHIPHREPAPPQDAADVAEKMCVTFYGEAVWESLAPLVQDGARKHAVQLLLRQGPDLFADSRACARWVNDQLAAAPVGALRGMAPLDAAEKVLAEELESWRQQRGRNINTVPSRFRARLAKLAREVEKEA